MDTLLLAVENGLLLFDPAQVPSWDDEDAAAASLYLDPGLKTEATLGWPDPAAARAEAVEVVRSHGLGAGWHLVHGGTEAAFARILAAGEPVPTGASHVCTVGMAGWSGWMVGPATAVFDFAFAPPPPAELVMPVGGSSLEIWVQEVDGPVFMVAGSPSGPRYLLRWSDATPTPGEPALPGAGSHGVHKDVLEAANAGLGEGSLVLAMSIPGRAPRVRWARGRFRWAEEGPVGQVVARITGRAGADWILEPVGPDALA
ncbi:MAG: hypothetical protein H6736_01810 [Alphaproteobacteria bacterium]|nr:hypothetical protein [Alphaproteobacteria bacterium]MCB9690527.1 hypothetical protein [Alphaproteobacteria bacterium]